MTQKILSITLVFTFLVSCSSVKATNNSFSSYKNINNLLISKFGWKSNQIGPIGQTYRIDIDKSNNRSFITLHNLFIPGHESNIKQFIKIILLLFHI